VGSAGGSSSENGQFEILVRVEEPIGEVGAITLLFYGPFTWHIVQTKEKREKIKENFIATHYSVIGGESAKKGRALNATKRSAAVRGEYTQYSDREVRDLRIGVD